MRVRLNAGLGTLLEELSDWNWTINRNRFAERLDAFDLVHRLRSKV